MERDANQTQKPSLCKAGCGFYGSAATDGMCSKCHKETMAKQSQASPVVAAAAGSSSRASPSPLLVSGRNVLRRASPDYIKKHLDSVLESKNDDDDDFVTNTNPNDPAPVPDPASLSSSPPKKTKARNRCHSCRKKVGLTGFDCRCGNVFCALHRYSDTHECPYDYAADARAELTKKNPAVVAAKIEKI